MGNKRRAAAIFAGLSGCAVLSVPVEACAAPMDLSFVSLTMDDLLASPWAYFAVGVLCGGGIVGLMMGLARHHATKRLRLALEKASREAVVIRIEGPGHVLDVGAPPRGPQGMSAPAPERASQDKKAPVELYAEEPSEASTTADLGRVHGLPVAPLIPMARPVHVSARLDALLPTVDGSPRPSLALAEVQSVARGSRTPAAAEAPKADDGAPQSGNATGDDRSHKGIGSAISNRLGTTLMDGLPVIERADGSTTDIGTSWWETAVGSTHSFTPLDSTSKLGMVPVDQAGDPMATSELRARELARAERNARAAGLSSAGTFARPATRQARAERAADIASRVPSFDLSLYPEEVEGSTSGEDMFEQAMRALDAQLPNAGVTTSEDAANVTTPLSADLKTGYVVTPESLGSTAAGEDPDAAAQAYVDSIMRDEMERRHSEPTHQTEGQRHVEGTHHHSFLTVFEGSAERTGSHKDPVARHLADPKKEKEA